MTHSDLAAAVGAPIAPAGTVAGRSTLAAYVALTKPRIIELLLVTTVPPMFLAAGGWPGGRLILATLVGGTMTAGAANAFNMVRDRDIDALMVRTRDRPLPAGQVGVPAALLFASLLGAGGVTLLLLTVNGLAAALTAAAMAFYVLVYSCWLKRTTVHNIVIGGAAGAVPALVGWAAVTGSLAPAAWVLFAVVFLWTPPHFWALAIVCDGDYTTAAVPMLPVVHGRKETARRSVRYAAATVGVSFLLPLTDLNVGLVYLAASALLGALFVLRAVQLHRDPRPAVARPLFTYSIVYLALLFAAVVADQVIPLPWG